VTADSHDQAKGFYGQAAEDEGGLRNWRGEKHDGGDGNKEPGWHHE
jgi:hypothetical protein